jgi:hypothetical protein
VKCNKVQRVRQMKRPFGKLSLRGRQLLAQGSLINVSRSTPMMLWVFQNQGTEWIAVWRTMLDAEENAA